MTPDLQTLRLTVLELMGWTGPYQKEFLEGMSNETSGGDLYAYCGTAPDGERCELPDPTTSLSDCEPLLEEAKKAGFKRYISGVDDIWWAEFINHKPTSRTYCGGEADTLPVAICLAFVKWKEAK